MVERILAHKSNEGSRIKPWSTLAIDLVRTTTMSTREKRLYECRISNYFHRIAMELIDAQAEQRRQ
jgi:hypothetical protein